MSDPEAQAPIRMMIIGDSGTGKTGGFASLALAGYNLWIADFDNGMEILRNAVAAKDKSALARIDFETCRDEYMVQGAMTVPKAATAWIKGINYLHNALNKQKLGPKDIVIVDSLSFAAGAAMLYQLKINNRLTGAPWQSDWGEAQRLVENLVGMLTSDVECHVICTAHIATTGGKRVEKVGQETVVIDEGPVKRLPAMIGKAFNPKVPRYFNHMILAHRVGSGAAANRVFHTVPFDDIELKNTNPGVIKPSYPLATGLADYFKDCQR